MHMTGSTDANVRFMSASKVLGEEGNSSAATAGAVGGVDARKAGRE